MSDEKFCEGEKDSPYTHVPDPDWVFYSRIIGGLIICFILLTVVANRISDENEKFWTAIIGSSVGLLILAANITQIWVARRQWRAMRENIQLTEEMFYLSERSYLAMETPSVPNTNFPNKFLVQIRNGGRTPAFNIRVKCGGQVTTKSFEESKTNMLRTLGQSSPVETILLAGDAKEYSVSTDKDHLDNENDTDWLRQKIRVFITIQLIHEDIHRDTQILTYCFEYFYNNIFRPVCPVKYEVYKPKRKKGWN